LLVFPESGGRCVIKVLLAEDQTIVRRGIAALLALTDDIRVAAEACDGAEALAAALKDDFDVALLDIRMPQLSGTQVIKEWAGMGKPLPAILLTTFDEDGLFLEAVQAGAHGFLLKDVSLERLADAVRTVAGGERLFQPVLTERVVRAIREMGTPFEAMPSPETLTPRERDILRLIAAGYSNREIASVLRMSEGAVKNHTSSILSKLGARDRTRAVLRGIERGLV
jgi:DNA-binding NarL/FixJ family response regulator